MEKAKSSNRLVGQGGVGLVMYRLACLGIDFTVTVDNGDGDLWIRPPGGRVMVAEVKTSSKGDTWPLRKNQLASAELFFFVNLKTTHIVVATREQLLGIIRSKRQSGDPSYTFSINSFRRVDTTKWDALLSMGAKIPPLKTRGPRRHARTVRKKMADGTYKEYHYPADETVVSTVAHFSETTGVN